MKNFKRISLLMVFAMLLSFVTPMSTFAEGEESKAVTTKAEEVKATETNTIDILTFNDFHGNLAEDVRETGKNIGMSKMVGYVNAARAKNPHTLVVSGGDNYQGSAMSNLTYGKPVSDMMKAMDVVASAVGNHEFDWGVKYIKEWAKDGDFSFLASNIYETATNKPVSWAKPYMIKEEKGVKIAFIGLAHPDTEALTKAENVNGLEFRDSVEAAQEWVNFLREGKAEEGTPDVIVAVTHLDSNQDRETKEITGTAKNLAENVKGLDAIVSAHSHRTVAGTVNGVAIVQAYKYGRALGKLEIQLDAEGKVSGIVPTVDMAYKHKNDIVADEATTATYQKYDTELGPILKEVLGQATAEFAHGKEMANTTPLGLWVCDVMKAKTGSQIALQNGGGLRRPMYAGDITYGDLYEIMPFDNTLVTMELPGKDLKKAIDHGIMNPNIGDGSFSGLLVEFDSSKEFENRLVSLKLADGTPVEDDKYYSIVVNDFMGGGGDKYDFSNAKNVVNTYVPIRDVLVEAVKANKSVSPMVVTNAVDVKGQVKEEVKQEVVTQNYTIAEGDFLWKIAKKFGTTYEELAKLNNLANPHKIFAGKTILVPAQ